jgi:hypothetical protein
MGKKSDSKESRCVVGVKEKGRKNETINPLKEC